MASESVQSGPAGPIRMCIGCRQRAAAADLLRVVVAPDAIGKAASPAPEPSNGLGGRPVVSPIVPDPRRRLPGRGAWLHRDLECVELAQRRRAFARALRVPGPVDPMLVCEYVAEANPEMSDQRKPAGDEELNGHSMKHQR